MDVFILLSGAVLTGFVGVMAWRDDSRWTAVSSSTAEKEQAERHQLLHHH